MQQDVPSEDSKVLWLDDASPFYGLLRELRVLLRVRVSGSDFVRVGGRRDDDMVVIE
jgi:hypothetical protein